MGSTGWSSWSQCFVLGVGCTTIVAWDSCRSIQLDWMNWDGIIALVPAALAQMGWAPISGTDKHGQSELFRTVKQHGVNTGRLGACPGIGVGGARMGGAGHQLPGALRGVLGRGPLLRRGALHLQLHAGRSFQPA